jgi:transcriptional regulator with XRE-family HTH domain
MPTMPDQEPQTHNAASELAVFGEDLRREREIRGISLKEIADATKISKRFLEALERNDHKILPAPVFTRGFVREYARYVGLNAEEMVNRYNFAASNDDRIEKPPALAKYAETPPRDITPKPPAKRGIPPAFSRVNGGAVFAFVIIFALGAVAYWAIQNKRRERELTDVPVSSIPVTTSKAAVTPSDTTPKPFDDSTLRLEIDVTKDSWVELNADGKRVFTEVMSAGGHHTFDAAGSFRFVNIGNAAGLTMTLNGTPVPPLGDDGEVVKNLDFDHKYLQSLRAAPQDPS